MISDETKTTETEHLNLARSRAQAWLFGLTDRLCANGRVSVSSFLQTLLGCWICETAFGTKKASSEMRSLAQEIQMRLDRRHRLFSLLHCDAALVLLSAGILRSLRCESSTVESLVQKVASSIQSRKHQNRTPEFRSIQFLLNGLNHQRPSREKKSRLAPAAQSSRRQRRDDALSIFFQLSNPFCADESQIRSIASCIAEATVYGRGRLSADPRLLEKLAIAHTVWMLSYLSQYNLELGALLLRTINYLRIKEEKALEMGINFILAQQQPDGRFGFLAREVSQIRSTRPHFDEVFDLYLPITVCCLWTIAEVKTPDFILFHSFRR